MLTVLSGIAPPGIAPILAAINPEVIVSRCENYCRGRPKMIFFFFGRKIQETHQEMR